MSNTDFLGRAIDAVKKAIEQDTAGDYDKAYQLYYQSLELFMLALKWEKNAKSKEMIRQKAGEYMERAEKLKNHINADNNKRKPAAMGANGKASNGAGKAQGDEDGAEEDPESKKLRGALAGAILTDKPNIKWEDVAGLEGAKEALKEAVILPIKFPHLFTGKRQPWKGILLYGPPGTGKSYLAKAVATEANSTFFSVSSSDLVSKWMGESERLVKQLFTMARENKPSIIFIDEVDALCGPRGEGESEASRRIKTELLVQMDGVGKDSKGVLILGATNIPWQLDAAIRRRFQRRVHISLPDLPARMRMFEISIGNTPCELKGDDYRTLAKLSDGYSGSDIAIAVQDALMQPVRKIQTATHYKKVTITSDEDGSQQEKLTPCSPGDQGAIEMNWTEVETEQLLEPPLQVKDFIKAIKGARPTNYSPAHLPGLDVAALRQRLQTASQQANSTNNGAKADYRVVKLTYIQFQGGSYDPQHDPIGPDHDDPNWKGVAAAPRPPSNASQRSSRSRSSANSDRMVSREVSPAGSLPRAGRPEGSLARSAQEKSARVGSNTPGINVQRQQYERDMNDLLSQSNRIWDAYDKQTSHQDMHHDLGECRKQILTTARAAETKKGDVDQFISQNQVSRQDVDNLRHNYDEIRRLLRDKGRNAETAWASVKRRLNLA